MSLLLLVVVVVKKVMEKEKGEGGMKRDVELYRACVQRPPIFFYL